MQAVQAFLLALWLAHWTAAAIPGIEDHLYCPEGYCRARNPKVPHGFTGSLQTIYVCCRGTETRPIKAWGPQKNTTEREALLADHWVEVTETLCAPEECSSHPSPSSMHGLFIAPSPLAPP